MDLLNLITNISNSTKSLIQSNLNFSKTVNEISENQYDNGYSPNKQSNKSKPKGESLLLGELLSQDIMNGSVIFHPMGPYQDFIIRVEDSVMLYLMNLQNNDILSNSQLTDFEEPNFANVRLLQLLSMLEIECNNKIENDNIEYLENYEYKFTNFSLRDIVYAKSSISLMRSFLRHIALRNPVNIMKVVSKIVSEHAKDADNGLIDTSVILYEKSIELDRHTQSLDNLIQTMRDVTFIPFDDEPYTNVVHLIKYKWRLVRNRQQFFGYSISKSGCPFLHEGVYFPNKDYKEPCFINSNGYSIIRQKKPIDKPYYESIPECSYKQLQEKKDVVYIWYILNDNLNCVFYYCATNEPWGLPPTIGWQCAAQGYLPPPNVDISEISGRVISSSIVDTNAFHEEDHIKKPIPSEAFPSSQASFPLIAVASKSDIMLPKLGNPSANMLDSEVTQEDTLDIPDDDDVSLFLDNMTDDIIEEDIPLNEIGGNFLLDEPDFDPVFRSRRRRVLTSRKFVNFTCIDDEVSKIIRVHSDESSVLDNVNYDPFKVSHASSRSTGINSDLLRPKVRVSRQQTESHTDDNSSVIHTSIDSIRMNAESRIEQTSLWNEVLSKCDEMKNTSNLRLEEVNDRKLWLDSASIDDLIAGFPDYRDVKTSIEESNSDNEEENSLDKFQSHWQVPNIMNLSSDSLASTMDIVLASALEDRLDQIDTTSTTYPPRLILKSIHFEPILQVKLLGAELWPPLETAITEGLLERLAYVIEIKASESRYKPFSKLKDDISMDLDCKSWPEFKSEIIHRVQASSTMASSIRVFHLRQDLSGLCALNAEIDYLLGPKLRAFGTVFGYSQLPEFPDAFAITDIEETILKQIKSLEGTLDLLNKKKIKYGQPYYLFHDTCIEPYQPLITSCYDRPDIEAEGPKGTMHMLIPQVEKWDEFMKKLQTYLNQVFLMIDDIEDFIISLKPSSNLSYSDCLNEKAIGEEILSHLERIITRFIEPKSCAIYSNPSSPSIVIKSCIVSEGVHSRGWISKISDGIGFVIQPFRNCEDVIEEDILLQQQSYRCFGCSETLRKDFTGIFKNIPRRNYERCQFLQKLFCHRWCCQRFQRATLSAFPLPSELLLPDHQQTQTSNRQVCRVVTEYLSYIYPKPILHVNDVNWNAISHCHSLDKVKQLRQQICDIFDIIVPSLAQEKKRLYSCDMIQIVDLVRKELQGSNDISDSVHRWHLLLSTDMFSLQDLHEIQTSSSNESMLQEKLEAISQYLKANSQ